MSNKKIGVLVGSLREGSFTKKLANVLTELTSEGYDAQVISIDGLEIYNPDLDTENAPVRWTEFREAIKAVDAVLFVTPEYNRTMPASIKNAIDVGSMPYGQSVWNNVPAAVVSAAAGALGGFGANHAIRQAVVFLNVAVMPAPEAYISNIHELFDGEEMNNEGTKAFLKSFMESFEAWIERVSL